MVIDTNSNINTSSGAPRNRVDSGSGSGQKPSAPDVKGEQTAKPEVSLSSQAQTLNRLESNIQAADDVDSDRVAAIQKAIADGSFEINAERIAENMLSQDELF
ncbi:MAG: flagellar biosynthesis anti-sigma factor FlgM [Cellvibrionaceae bacterium]|nr:flagellar biosynthesis anti-sigma factor FlgM [Cellvibrionaceae bacterium]